MNDFKPGQNREEKIDKFLDNLAWFHSEKTTPSGLYSKIGKIEERIDELNKQLVEAGKSSGDLAKALNGITLAASVIAALTLLWSVVTFFIK